MVSCEHVTRGKTTSKVAYIAFGRPQFGQRHQFIVMGASPLGYSQHGSLLPPEGDKEQG